MNKKQILFGALLGLPALAMADVKFTIDPLTIAPGDKGDMARTVTVNVELSEGSNLSTFDMLIDLPKGLTMKGTDYVNTTTDYGWSLTRSRQTDSQYKFVGYQKNNNHLKPADGGAAKKVVAFTFEVEAADAPGFDPKTAGDITIHDVTVADMTDPVNNPTLKVQDNVSTPAGPGVIVAKGKVVGINKLEGKDFYNPLWFDYLDKDGNAATCGDPNGYDADTEYKGNFNLTPKHTYHLTLNLDNSEKYDGLGNLLGGDEKVRSIEGIFHLPKGVKVKSMTRTGRTLIEDTDLGSVYVENGERLQKFSVLAASAPLKNVAEYGTAILEFELEADNDFDVQQADILVTDFIAGKFGSPLRYTMEQEFTFVVDNPNQVAKDQKDTEIGDPSTDGTVWGNYQAAINAENDSVKNCVALKDPTTGAEALASKAISDYAAEVLKQYQNGDLATWKDSKEDLALQKAANDAIANITTVNNGQLAIARQKAKAANDAISATEPKIPTYLDQEAAIKDIKDQRTEGNPGTLKNAKEALGKYNGETLESGLLYDAIAAGTLSDADFTAAIDAITGAEGQIKKLEKAIEAAQAAKAIEDGKAQNALDAPVALLEEVLDANEKAYISQDDTDGTYAAAWDVYEEKIDDLKAAFGTNGEDGTVGAKGKAANPDVYKTEIEAVEAAIAGVAAAVETVKGKAAKNNAAAEQAKDDYKLLPNISQDDTQKTWTNAKDALDQAVADAAEAGTQAKDNIYKAAIKALADALQTVKDEADANNQKITDAQDKQDYKDALANAADGANPTIAANEELKAAIEAFNKAKGAMFDKQTAAEDKGTQAQDGIYEAEIKDVLDKAKALNDKVAELLATAAANEKAVNDLVKVAVKPVGTEDVNFMNNYDALKNGEPIPTLEGALAQAIQDLDDALQSAKDNGLLADNEYLDGEGNQKSLDLAKAAVTKAVADLEAEYKKQEAQAAKNMINVNETFINVLAVTGDLVDLEGNELVSEDVNVDDVRAAKIVTDLFDNSDLLAPTGELAEAFTALNTQYSNMGTEAKLGNEEETQKLNEAIETVNNLLDEFIQAVKDANAALEEVNDMTADVDDLKKSFTDTTDDELLSELEKAKVANPAEVANPAGQLPTTQAQYEDLVDILNGYADAVQAQVDQVKADFIAGKPEMTKDKVETWMNETLPTLKEAAKEFTANKLVEYLQTVQRGDVNGDGRWTSADYAKIRKMILDEDYPEVTVEIDEFGHLQGITIEKDAEGKVVNTEAVYTFASFDVNQDGDINVGDAQGALNYAYYGAMTKPGAGARSAANVAESLTAEMVGNRIAVSLTNSREYSALQMDVVLPEGMTIEGQSVADRNDGFSIAASQLKNGATRIVVTANEAGNAFAGNEGEVLYIDVNGQGTVSFENIIFADVNAGTQKFQLASVTGGIATGIAAAKSENGMMETIYNMGGRLMNGLKKGINIIRRADGTTEKVIKK